MIRLAKINLFVRSGNFPFAVLDVGTALFARVKRGQLPIGFRHPFRRESMRAKPQRDTKAVLERENLAQAIDGEDFGLFPRDGDVKLARLVDFLLAGREAFAALFFVKVRDIPRPGRLSRLR